MTPYQSGFKDGIEAAASLHESVNPASDNERLAWDPGAGAMGAVLEYRDLIRSIPIPLAESWPKDAAVERVARAICEAEDVDPDKLSTGIGRLIPVGETWPLWKLRTRQAEAALRAAREPAP